MEKNIIIDNGSYEIKYGLNTDVCPIHVPNCIYRTPDKRVVLGDQLSQLQDTSNIHIRRPIEANGQLTQWLMEKQIWDETFLRHKGQALGDDFLKDANLIYLETPITLTKFQNHVDQVIFEEYGVANYYRCSGGSLAPWLTADDASDSSLTTDVSNEVEDEKNKTEDTKKTNQSKKNSKAKGKQPKPQTVNHYSDFQLVIDSGFDSTWVIPVIYGLPYWKAVKRMPIGGRILNGYLRELISFRHYNVTDETLLVNKIKETSCYVTTDFNESLAKIEALRKKPSRKKQRVLSKDPINTPNNHDKKSKDEDSSTVRVKDPRYPQTSDDLVLNYVLPSTFSTAATISSSSSSSSTTTSIDLGHTLTTAQLQTTPHAKLQNLQIIQLQDERFTVPELIFQPELAGLHKAGLIQTVQESLKLCPELIRPLLLANVVTIGGGFNLPGFKERLVSELKAVIGVDEIVRVFEFDNAGCADVWKSGSGKGKDKDVKRMDFSEVGFHSAKKFYEFEGFKKTCVSRDEYMEFGAEYTQEKFGYKLNV
ncbi:unnamed protein product [Ambrosiozyma monospora]|uniref:Unnamed protein product n=1 Tax=Ambrosiozyma monospora TaxID=43982 RepID=A0ACB5SR26_AMBMO|nr:unnamed protein product [Ambrosiozyma monospora]